MKKRKQQSGVTYFSAGIAVLLFVTLLLSGLPLSVRAAESTGQESVPSVPVFLDGRATGFRAAVFRDGTAFLPLSLLARMLPDNGTFSFDRKTGTAEVSGDGILLHARAGDCYLESNGRYFALSGLDPAENLLYDGTLYVPVRTAARAMNGTAEWDAERRAVSLWRGRGTLCTGEDYYDEDALSCLSHILSSEAGDQPLSGQLAVGAVIMNRVKSPEFPDTVWGVVFDRRYAVQFTPTANGTYWREPEPLSVIAAKLILEGCLVSEDALYFLDPRLASSFWILRNRTYLFSAGAHDFYS